MKHWDTLTRFEKKKIWRRSEGHLPPHWLLQPPPAHKEPDMNKTVGQDILTNIEKELDILNKESAEHVARSSFTDIVSKLESDDITVQTHLYNDLVTMSCSSAVERLRQRAMMMRQRADEFDATADKMVKDQKNLEEISYALNKLYLTVEKLIADHAHIKPTETR